MVIPSYTKEGYAENAVRADTANIADTALTANYANYAVNASKATSASTALSADYAPNYTPLSTFNETLGDLSSIIHEI